MSLSSQNKQWAIMMFANSNVLHIVGTQNIWLTHKRITKILQSI